jgi:hypothetical protein
MGKTDKQAEAANHIQEFLSRGGHSISPRKITMDDNQHWIIFALNQREIGIDSASGVWIRKSVKDDWVCIAVSCTVSGAIQAVEFLISG